MGQFFMTRSELGLSMFGDSRVCRDNTHLRDHLDAHPTGSIDVNGKFGPSLDVLVTKGTTHDFPSVFMEFFFDFFPVQVVAFCDQNIQRWTKFAIDIN